MLKFKYSVGDLVQTVWRGDSDEAQTIYGIILETNEGWKPNGFLEETRTDRDALENEPHYKIHPNHPPTISGVEMGGDWWIPERNIELKAKP